METASDQKTYALFSNVENRELAEKLEQKGAKVFRFAAVTIHRITSKETAETIKNNLREFDWIVFPDVFAADCFLQILEEIGIDPFELDAVQILACGEAVADRLRFVQIHADVIPQTIKTETIFSTLLNYLGEDKLGDRNFLIAKAVHFETALKDELTESGANVTEIAVYQAEIDDKNKTANLKALLKGGAIDELIFSSPEDVLSLKHYLLTEDLSEILRGVITSGTNESAMQALRENDLRPKFFHIK
jgi:uroporphyrinogen-III synthase